MAFPSGFLDELRQRVSLVEVVRRKVALRKAGREWQGLCPFHSEKSPSFTVSETKGFFHCFGCGAHGSVFDFVMETEGLSFPEAVERLAGEAGLEVPRPSPEAARQADRRERLLEVAALAHEWYRGQLAGAAGAPGREYLARRGLEPETIERFQLGFAPGGREAFRQAMAARGVAPAELLAAGLARPLDREAEEDSPPPRDMAALRDFFFNRVLFPITDPRGRVVAFGGRALGEAKPKYLNSPEGELFAKGRLLYNLARARPAAHDAGEVVLVEGYLDVIALDRAGFPAAVAPLGTSVTEAQLAALWRLAPEPLVCLDGDQAGLKAAQRLVELAAPLLEPGRSLRFALLPPGEDPDSLIASQGRAALARVLESARPFAELAWASLVASHRHDTPEHRAAFRRAVRDWLGRLADREVRQAYEEDFAARLEARAGGPGRRPAGIGRAAERSGRGQRPWRPGNSPRFPAPAGDPSAERWANLASAARTRASSVRKNCEAALFLILLDHPTLIPDLVEDLAEIEFQDRRLTRLAGALLDLAATGRVLDKQQLLNHLTASEMAPVLAHLAAAREHALRQNALPRCSRLGASEEMARIGWDEQMAMIRSQRLRAETEYAVSQLADDPSTEALARAETLGRLQARQRANPTTDVETEAVSNVSIEGSGPGSPGRR